MKLPELGFQLCVADMVRLNSAWLLRPVVSTVFLLCATVVYAEKAPVSRKECESMGGSWSQFEKIIICDLPTRDSGKPCSDSRDCQSACVASGEVPAESKVQGQCFSRSSTLGTCLNLVVGGVAQGVVCED